MHISINIVDKNLLLFDIAKDPEERTDLTNTHPYIVDILLRKLASWNAEAVPVNYPSKDPSCRHVVHKHGAWVPWLK